MKPSTIFFLIVLAVVALATVIISAMAYREFTKQTTAKTEIEAVIPVHVHTVANGEVEDKVFLTGFVEPGDRVDVIAKLPMPGKLIAANVKKGEMVTKNQVLATVDRDEVGADYRPFPIKAPMDGMVVSIQDDPGSLVLNSRPFAAIVNLNEVKVRASIIESDMVRVKPDNPAQVRVDAKPDQTFDGAVSLVESVLDSYAHTAPIEITISNSGGELLPGMFARVAVVVGKHSDVPLIPKDAVFKRENKNYCYLAKADEKGQSRIYMTELQLGYFDGQNYEVVSGLAAGDRVVDRELVVLKDRTEVKLSNPEGEAAGEAAGSTAEAVVGSTAEAAAGSTAGAAAGSTAAPAAGSTTPAAGSTTPAAGSTAPAAGSTATPAAP
jgi:multidrug efflux pump subunit AcrA (membrane-fusion protein)